MDYFLFYRIGAGGCQLEEIVDSQSFSTSFMSPQESCTWPLRSVAILCIKQSAHVNCNGIDTQSGARAFP